MWHEARRSEKKVHDMMDAARKRAQRRAVFLAKRRRDPHQSIQVLSNRCRIYRDDGLYVATQDEQGLLPWNGKEDVLIDRFDGRALLDFIREAGSRRFRQPARSEEEEELEEFVNFERYRDLIKHRRKGYSDEEGLQYVDHQMEAKIIPQFAQDSNSRQSHTAANKGAYSQVGFSYDRDGKEDGNSSEDDDGEEEDVDDELNSDDSNDEEMEKIAKEFGVKRFRWLVYMDKKTKEEEKRQKEIIKGDPAIRKLSRKERRKVSQIERERERQAARLTGSRTYHHDPYRESRRSPTYEAYSRSRRSRSHSPSPYGRRHGSRSNHSDDAHGHHGKPKAPKIEYITEFGSASGREEPKMDGYFPPSPPHTETSNRPSYGQILEALHVDPASGASYNKENGLKAAKPSASSTSTLSKLTKANPSGPPKLAQVEKKETPQERLKRIMNKQLNKQIKKDTAAELAKRREQERQRLEKIEESSRHGRYRHRSRSYSPSPPRRNKRSRSPVRSSRRRRSPSYSRSPSDSRSPTSSPRSPK